MPLARSSPENLDSKGGDKAGPKYWDRKWKKASMPAPIDPYRPGLKNYPFRQYHNYFGKVFAAVPTRGKKLLEIGCAQSAFLPYFAKYFGFEVCGLDRSQHGCERAEAMLRQENVSGRVYCSDLFCPPPDLLGAFDVLFSLGVVEHFEPTSNCLRAMARLLKPGGRMITVIPNLLGINGKLQKVLNRSVFDIHVLMNRDDLARAHEQAGLEVESCEYFLPLSLEHVDVTDWSNRFAYWFTIRTHGVISRCVWLVEEHFPILRANRWTSPNIHCVARRPGLPIGP